VRGVLILLIGSLPCLVSGQEVGLQEFVRQLSNQQGFEAKGVELLGNTRIEITDSNAKTEEMLSRALRHYNHVVRYADGSRLPAEHIERLYSRAD